jgi:hypothetical protein
MLKRAGEMERWLQPRPALRRVIHSIKIIWRRRAKPYRILAFLKPLEKHRILAFLKPLEKRSSTARFESRMTEQKIAFAKAVEAAFARSSTIGRHRPHLFNHVDNCQAHSRIGDPYEGSDEPCALLWIHH